MIYFRENLIKILRHLGLLFQQGDLYIFREAGLGMRMGNVLYSFAAAYGIARHHERKNLWGTNMKKHLFKLFPGNFLYLLLLVLHLAKYSLLNLAHNFQRLKTTVVATFYKEIQTLKTYKRMALWNFFEGLLY